MEILDTTSNPIPSTDLELLAILKADLLIFKKKKVDNSSQKQILKAA